jgi:hypothetical protein
MFFVRRFVSTLALAAILLPAVAQNTQQQPSQTPPSQQPYEQQQQKPKCADNRTYTNSQGQPVKRPENCSAVPQGVTAQCRD